MSTNDPRPNPNVGQRENPKRVRDVPGCIKYIILLFLLILFFGEIYAGEFRRFPELPTIIWLILFIKLLLIILLIILIWVQHQLTCEITSPKNCTGDEHDAEGDPFIKVIGSVGGSVFGHYLLEVWDSTSSIIPGVVTYPGGGASGTSTVSNGELGRIDTSDFDPGMHTVKLRVFSTSGSEKNPPCVSTFDYMRFTVFVRAVGNLDITDTGAYSGDPAHKIKLIKDGPDEQSEGGSTNVLGGAYLHGCGKRTIQYLLEYRSASPAPAEPPELITAGGWTNVQAPIPYGDALHPYWWNCFIFHIPNFVTNAELTRVWSASQCGVISKPLTASSNWATHAGAGLNGRYTVRVVERHAPAGGSPVEEIIDGATVWLDNRTIIGKIRNLRVTGAPSGLSPCEELELTQFQPSGGLADIIGQAWDPLIVNGLTSKPSENFGHYELSLKKDGGPHDPPDPPLTPEYQTIAIGPLADGIEPTVPVPGVRQVAPPPLSASDILTKWNIIAALDAGNLPSGSPPDTLAPYPKLYRGQRCAYIIRLFVTDTTSMHNGGTTNHKYDDFPFCIMNDIPPDPEL